MKNRIGIVTAKGKCIYGGRKLSKCNFREDINELRSAMEMEALQKITSYAPDVERHAVNEMITYLTYEVNFLRRAAAQSKSAK
jgi:hypothetical protein